MNVWFNKRPATVTKRRLNSRIIALQSPPWNRAVCFRSSGQKNRSHSAPHVPFVLPGDFTRWKRDEKWVQQRDNTHTRTNTCTHVALKEIAGLLWTFCFFLVHPGAPDCLLRSWCVDGSWLRTTPTVFNTRMHTLAHKRWRNNLASGCTALVDEGRGRRQEPRDQLPRQ